MIDQGSRITNAENKLLRVHAFHSVVTGSFLQPIDRDWTIKVFEILLCYEHT